MSRSPRKIDFDRTRELPSFADIDHDLSAPLAVMCVVFERAGHTDTIDEPPIALEIAAQQALEIVVPIAIFANRFESNIVGLFANAQDCLHAAESIIDSVPFKGEVWAKVGMHRGQIRHDGSRLSGQAVETASRIMRRAAPNWALTSRSIYDHVSADRQVFLDSLDYLQIDRNSRALEVFKMAKRQDLVVTLDSASTWAPYERAEISVTGRNHVDVVRNEAVGIGRGSQNDIVVSDMYVSVEHARIERHGGEFVLVDLSSNGTYMVVDDEAPFKVPHEFRLRRNARIWLGRHTSDPEATTLDIFLE